MSKVDYQSQFGSLSFVKGEECSSVLSASAYLLALIRLKDDFIRETSGLKLSDRRPDIWDIPLDCQHTNTPISYVEVVNRVLENQEDKIYENIKSAKYPFNLPLNISLVEIESYTKELNINLIELYKTFAPKDNIKEDIITKVSLGLSNEEYKIFTTTIKNKEELAPYFGFKSSENLVKELSNVKVLTKVVGINYDELREILRENLSKDEQSKNIANNFFINSDSEYYLVSKKGTLKKTRDNISFEFLTEDDFGYFEKLNRFIRLAKKLNFSYSELNWILQSYCNNTLDAKALQIIALIKKLKERYEVSVEDITLRIKNIGKGYEYEGSEVSSDEIIASKSHFDRVFNNPFKYLNDFIALPNEEKLSLFNERLLGALKIKESDLESIYKKLSINEDSKATYENLSTLYRISNISQLLSIDIEEFFTLIDLLDKEESENSIEVLKSNESLSIVKLIDRVSEITLWLKERDIKVAELSFISRGEPNREFGKPIEDLKEEVYSTIKSKVESYHKHIDSINSKIKDTKLPPIQKDKPYQKQLVTLIQKLNELSDKINKELEQKIKEKSIKESEESEEQTINIEMEKSLKKEIKELKISCDKFHNELKQDRENIYIAFANLFSSTPVMVKIVADKIANSLIDETLKEPFTLIDFLPKLDFKDKSVKEIDDSNFLQILQQWLYIIQKVSLSAEELNILSDNYKYFGFSNSINIFSLRNIKTIYDFHALSQKYSDDNHPLSHYIPAPNEDSTKVLQFIKCKESCENIGEIKTFASLLEIENKKVIAESLKLTFNGVKENLYNPLWSENINLSKVTQTLYALVSAKLDEKKRESLRQKLNLKKRNALVPYVIDITSQKLKEFGVEISTVRELYEYLLIDVEMGDEFKTSYISEAVTAMHTYIERALLNMEIGGSIAIDKRKKFEELWQWMRSYRLWEANRQVFLYPENYLEPELRKEKSELFKEFETNIKKSEIDKESVEIAFRNYVDDFANIAKLQIAGSCVYKEGKDKVFVYFGRTRVQPHTYYYRTAKFIERGDSEFIEWKPWQKIELKINADKVSPLFVYDRLFLFWGERVDSKGQKVDGKDGETLNNAKFQDDSKTSIQLYFSFQNTESEWIQPQSIDKPKDIKDTKRVIKHHFMPHPFPYTKISEKKIPVELGVQATIDNENRKIKLIYGNTKYTDTNKDIHSISINQDLELSYQKEGTFKIATLPSGLSGIYRDSISIVNSIDNWTTFETTNNDTFLIKPKVDDSSKYTLIPLSTNSAHSFSEKLFNSGIDGLLQLKSQQIKDTNYNQVISDKNQIIPFTNPTYLDFNGSYGSYYWELFLHAPFYISETLKKNQKFDDANKWYHYICNPTEDDIWQFLPLRKKFNSLFDMFREGTGSVAYPKLINFEDKSSLWIKPKKPLKKRHHVMNFNNNRYLNCGLFLSNLISNQFSVSVSVYIEDSLKNNIGVIASQGDIDIEGKGESGFILFFDKGEIKAYLKRVDEESVSEVKVQTSFKSYNEFVHIAFSWSLQDGATLYINANIESSEKGDISKSLNLSPNHSLYIGTNENRQNPFNGHIIDLSIWSKFFTQSEIEKIKDINLSGYEENLIGYWDLTLNSKKLDEHSNSVYSVTFSPDGKYLASGSQDNTIRVWKKVGRKWKSVLLRGDSGFVYSVSFSPDGKYLASGSQDNTIRVWKKVGREWKSEILEGHSSFVNSVTFSPDGKYLASGSYDKTIRVWEKVGREWKSELLSGHSGSVYSVSFSPDGKYLASGSLDKTIIIWEKVGREWKSELLRGHSGIVYSVTFSPDGKYLASGSQDNTIRVWKKVGREWKSELLWGHSDWVYSVSFSPDGKYLASGSTDETIRVWEKVGREWKCKQILEGHSSSVTSVSFSPDGKYLASGSRDYTIRVWDVAQATIKNRAINSNSEYLSSIDAYKKEPYNPYAIANIRPLAYKKTIMMHYISNLLEWGDYLFRQNSRDSILEAQMFYMRAYNMLGDTPINLGKVPKRVESKTLQNIIDDESRGDSLKDEFIEMENELPDDSEITEFEVPHNYIAGLYFSVPENNRFIKYWDRVEDRLYKIRNSLSIEGVKQKLPLFAPPIDPMALVKAQSSSRGVDSVVSKMSVEVPHYRFSYMIERAKEYTNSVIALGDKLLNALEKGDAEELSRLQNESSRTILDMSQQIKIEQINQAVKNIEALEKNKKAKEESDKFFDELIKKGLSPQEKEKAKNTKKAEKTSKTANTTKVAASVSSAVPQVGSPLAMTFGGIQLGAVSNAIAESLEFLAKNYEYLGDLNSILGANEKQKEDLKLQQKINRENLTEIDVQIEVAKLQEAIAKRELEILQKNIKQEESIDTFMKSKFSNKELYEWMSKRLIELYSQSFQMANDMAFKAQKAMQYELTDSDEYLGGTYWDSLKKGLLAGESLYIDLEKMQKAYIEKNRRRLEISKTVSLAHSKPFVRNSESLVLNILKKKKKTQFSLTEKMFDLDFAGHYARQIKSISISFAFSKPLAPYESINATLTQLSHKTLIKPDKDALDYLFGKSETSPDNSILRQDWRQNEEIALSRGVNDRGLFELNFQDERYLPFEGTGAISDWELEVSSYSEKIDEIEDVIITIEYSALSDASFKAIVQEKMKK